MFEPGASWTLPPAADGTVRMLYLFDGAGLDVAGHTLGARTGAGIDATEPVELTAGDQHVEALIAGSTGGDALPQARRERRVVAEAGVACSK